MRIIQKISSAILAFFFIFSCNFCLAECAFASEEHSHSAQVDDGAVHHSESHQNHAQPDSEKHNAGTLCCSSLVAVKTSQSETSNIKLTKIPFSDVVTLERSIPQLDAYFGYEIEFPPGASPPAVFLLGNFTHAPPVSL